MERRVSQITTLSQALAGATDAADLARLVVRHTDLVLGAAESILASSDPETGELRVVAASGAGPRHLLVHAPGPRRRLKPALGVAQRSIYSPEYVCH